jgi:hypothetical protein
MRAALEAVWKRCGSSWSHGWTGITISGGLFRLPRTTHSRAESRLSAPGITNSVKSPVPIQAEFQRLDGRI